MTLRRLHPADTPHKTAHGEADREPTHAWSIRVSATSRGAYVRASSGRADDRRRH